MLETRHRGLLMVAVTCVSIIQFLDLTIANVALPHMRSSLGASLESISWVLTSYIIASVMCTPVVGWLSDRIGSRRVYLLAVGGFLLASMLCGAATSLVQMVAFRALQGAAAGFIGAMSQTIMFDITSPSKQPAAISLWGVAVMIAPITGPMIGGLLTESLNWRWVFYINLPIGIPTLLVLIWLLPTRPQTERKLDRFGFCALAIALVALQLMLDRGQHRDWFQSREIIVELLVALSAFWVFVVHTTTTKNSLFPAGLLKNPNFVNAFILMFVLGLANVAIVSILPTMYQTVFNYAPFDTGLLLMPRGIGVGLMMIVATRLMDKVDIRYLITFGFFVASFALWRMSEWSLEMGRGPILVTNFIQGLGLGLIFMPMTIAAFTTLDPRYRPDGSSLLNLMRNLGGSFGISAIFTMLSRNTQTGHADMAANITPYRLPGIDPTLLVDRFGVYGTGVLQAIDGEINRQALMIAYLDNFRVMSILIVFFALGALLLKPARVRAGRPPEPLE